jgi:(R)-2-hydroxyacyl-CoA dehydratese activating ATPase
MKRSTGISLGLDVGSTYTKAVLVDSRRRLLGRAMAPTGSRLQETARQTADAVLDAADLERADVEYTITTGYGRHQVPFRDLQVTDLTAAARGARHLFPGAHTVLDVGGQTMKASRLDDAGKVETFRLNDKCAAGTGAFLEKTARYMGYATADIAELLVDASETVPISGVCAVFAESEVISHLSEGVHPQAILLGAIHSLTERSVQLLRRIKAEPEYVLVGGILRWPAFARLVAERLGEPVRLAEGDLPQYVSALGCAVLGQIQLARRDRAGAERPEELQAIASGEAGGGALPSGAVEATT